MGSVSGKYLKDESGNKFSPITSAQTVYYDATNKVTAYTAIEQRLQYNVLWTGSLQVPSYSTGTYTTEITLTDDITNYSVIFFIANYTVLMSSDSGVGWSTTNECSGIISSTYGNERFNMFGSTWTPNSSNKKKIKFRYGRLAQISAGSSVTYFGDYGGVYINAVVGLKIKTK